MWHTVAYTKSVAGSGSDVNLPGVAENALQIGTQNGFRLLENMFLMTAWSLPANGTGYRLNSPKFAQFSKIEILPVGPGVKQTDGTLIASWPYRAPSFRPQEEVVASVDNGATAASQETLIVSLAKSIDPIPNGEELTIKWTGTTTMTANAWTLIGAPTLAIVLPEGAYAMIASHLQGATAGAHRWIFSGQFYRPGFPSTVAFSDRPWPGQFDYRQGLAGTFSNITLPQCEAWCSSADTAQTGFMRVIKVA